MAETGISFDNLMKIWSDKEKYISVAKRYLQDSEKAKDIFPTVSLPCSKGGNSCRTMQSK